MPIPKKARTDNYPVVGRDGFVFVFLGDAPEHERPPVPPIETLEPIAKAQAKGYAVVQGEFVWNANFELVELRSDDGRLIGAQTTGKLDPPPASGMWKYLRKGKERPLVKTKTGLYFPNGSLQRIVTADDMRTGTVIPSLARRANPELANAWVLKEVASRMIESDRAKANGQAPRCPLVGGFGPVGMCRTFRQPGTDGADGITLTYITLTYIAMTVAPINLDSHMLYAYTPPASAVPHFTLDSICHGDGFAFHLDLPPRVDPGASLVSAGVPDSVLDGPGALADERAARKFVTGRPCSIPKSIRCGCGSIGRSGGEMSSRLQELLRVPGRRNKSSLPVGSAVL